MSRRLPFGVALVLALAAAALLTAGSSAQAAAGLSITSDQPFVPGFSRTVSDYVVRCNGSPLNVSVSSDPSTLVSVDGAAFASGSFARAVPLSTGQEFRIAIRQGTSTQLYYVRCLPADFPLYTYERDGNPSPSLFAMTPDFGDPGGQSTQYLAVFDSNGVPVWWYKAPFAPNDAKVLADSTVAYWSSGEAVYHVLRLNGQAVRNVGIVGWYTDLHELQRLDNGDYLVAAYLPRDHVNLLRFGGPADTQVWDALVQEVTPAGQVVWSWNSGDHIGVDQTPQRWYDAILPGSPPYDIVHMNSIEQHGNEIVISMRHTDAVWAINKRTGDVLWKIGGVHSGKSLTILGDPQVAYPLGGQHDARFLPDGTLTIHDNNTAFLAPRAVRYRVDERLRTARLVESVSDPQVPVSFCCGSARRLDDGSWLASWGGVPIVAGYAPGGARTFKLDFGGVFSYRANPVPRTVTAPALRSGMDAQYPR
jgi:arylsulfotransferase ASST